MRTIIITLLTIISFSVIAQEMNYNWQFEVVNNAYVPIQNGISVNNGEIWCEPDYIIPIGFTFKFGQYTCTEIKFIENLEGGGFGLVPNNQVYDSTNQLVPLILPMGAFLCDRDYYDEISSMSPLSYSVEGVEGSRIFKLQIENAGFLDEIIEIEQSNSYINYQLWLYEGSGIFEFHYGSSYIDDFSLCFYNIYGPKVGFCYLAYIGLGHPIRHLLLLDGNPSAPNTVMIDSAINVDIFEDQISFLSSVPDSGTVYSFQINEDLSISQINFRDITAFPNPGNDYFNIIQYSDYRNTELYLYDMSGSLLLQQKLYRNHETINTALLSSGIYSYSIVKEENVIYSGKWIKK